jgi:hypothetical protein
MIQEFIDVLLEFNPTSFRVYGALDFAAAQIGGFDTHRQSEL